MYALVDCNNFFVSCERVFQPELEGRAVVVLSNNDGCIVARSNESKAMGIKMGTPFFKVKNLVDNGSLIVRSSNYKLYGDLSARVMSILSDAIPEIEVYSIDEAFLVLQGMTPDQENKVCRDLVKKVRRWTGIPISIGIASSKTLAKVANHFAKKYKGYKGVCRIDNEEKRLKALSLTPIDDIWGIGRRTGPKLLAAGVKTALDFVQRPQNWVNENLGINGVRTWLELQGQSIIPEEIQERRQSICTSRSFADMIEDFGELSLRVSDFAGTCAAKLRSEGSAAHNISTFIYTNRFREDMKQYFPTATIRLEVPTNTTHEICGAALKALKTIYKPGFLYKKAGVIVDDIVDASNIQLSIFDEDSQLREREMRVSELMDKFNSAGHNVLRLATQRGGHYSDGIRREHCSGDFTTSLDDLIRIK